MTIPGNQAEIDNLKKIAELNEKAGDWVYSPVVDSADNSPATKDVLKRVGDHRLSSKN